LNWRVIVVEDNGRVHDTMINLGRSKETVVVDNATRAARVDALYKPRVRAVWRIYRRYGPRELPEEEQRRIRRAWYAWQATPFGWQGRYAVFDAFYQLPDGGRQLACVGFEDLRLDGARNTAKGTWIVCPGQSADLPPPRQARRRRPVGRQHRTGAVFDRQCHQPERAVKHPGASLWLLCLALAWGAGSVWCVGEGWHMMRAGWIWLGLIVALLGIFWLVLAGRGFWIVGQLASGRISPRLARREFRNTLSNMFMLVKGGVWKL
jgi:hypothetical protein